MSRLKGIVGRRAVWMTSLVSGPFIGCGEKGAIELIDSHGVKIVGNDFRGYARAVHADDASTRVSKQP